jgi:hypothetical protein
LRLWHSNVASRQGVLGQVIVPLRVGSHVVPRDEESHVPSIVCGFARDV